MVHTLSKNPGLKGPSSTSASAGSGWTQRQVSFVQVAHGRHEGGVARSSEGLTQLGEGVDDVHRSSRGLLRVSVHGTSQWIAVMGS